MDALATLSSLWAAWEKAICALAMAVFLLGMSLHAIKTGTIRVRYRKDKVDRDEEPGTYYTALISALVVGLIFLVWSAVQALESYRKG